MPGVILAAKKIVMRTEGVIVESLLGQAEALDDYSRGLQEEAVRERRLSNDQAEAELEKARLANEIVKNGDSGAAAVFAQVFTSTDQEDTETT